MTLPENISADYTLRPSDLAEVLATLVEALQPTLVWGPPGAAKSMIARQVAGDHGYNYVDIRALLLDPVDLRGIPWRDKDGRTRWAPPVFLPPTASTALWLLNLEELPSAVPMVQAALYQLFLERKCGEYELPEGASLIACGNRESDRGVVHCMPAPLSNRLVHLEIRVDARDWCAWGAANDIAPEVLFFIELEPDLLHQFDPQSKEHAFPSPRSWEFASNIVKHRNGLDPATERALFRGTVGEAAAVKFIETTVFTIDELSDAAKENRLKWLGGEPLRRSTKSGQRIARSCSRTSLTVCRSTPSSARISPLPRASNWNSGMNMAWSPLPSARPGIGAGDLLPPPLPGTRPARAVLVL